MYTLKNYKEILNLCLKLEKGEGSSPDQSVSNSQEIQDTQETQNKISDAGKPSETSDNLGKFEENLDNVKIKAEGLKIPQQELSSNNEKQNEGQSIEVGFQMKGEELVLEGLPQEGLKEGSKLQFNLEGIPEDDSIKGLPTYGGSLPETVTSVKVNGVTYERLGVNGEFVDSKTKKPLEMEVGQTLSISQVIDSNELAKKKENARNKYEELKKGNPELGQYEEQITTAIEKGISPDSLLDDSLLNFILLLFGIDNKGNAVGYSTIGREGDGNGFGRPSFNAGSYNGVDDPNLKPGIIKNYKVPAKSEPYAHSGTSTLCSQTARLNLEKMGVIGVTRGNAFDAWKQMGSPKQPFPPKENGNIKAIDLFVASKSKYGHRACAFIENGKWFVLDPYRSGKSTAPIPAEEYMSKNQIVGAFYYSLES